MTNRKQDGSNILSWEYSTGICPTQCEQCFCNLGMQGQSVPGAFLGDKSKKWQEFANREAKQQGRPALGTKVTPSMKGLQNIPRSSAKKEAPYKRRIKTIKPSGFGVTCIPFLRISSMSDCSYYPPEVIQHLRDLWGEYGFFNSAIRSFLKRPENLIEHAHKFVITTNPGRQKIIAPGIPNRPQAIAASMQGSGGKYGFMTPKTMSDVGYPELEEKIKFYRLRAMPTIIPRIDTDRPVVITQLRFRTAYDAAAWAKRYGVDCRVNGQMTQKKAKLLSDLGAAVSIKKNYTTEFLFRAKHRENVADRAGEWCRYIYEDAWFRPDLSEAWQGESTGLDDYVCDRIHKACVACGLCATLDGTTREQLNLVDGEPVGPVPGEAHYLYHFATRENAEMGYEFFEDKLEEIFDGESVAPLSRREAESFIEYITEYVSQSSYHCEGWNTHEKAITLANAVAFGLLQNGFTPGVVDSIFEAAGLSPAGIVDIEALYDGTSDFCDVFGELR